MSEEIFGLDTGPDDAARLMNKFIRKDWIAMEPQLYRGKWFDYRYLNPVQATYLYAHEFVRFYRLTYSKNFSSERGPYVTPLKLETLFEIPEGATSEQIRAKKQLVSGIWRGRMFADAMGMPYPEYLEFAFHWTMRYWKQRNPPRPQQLYSDLVTDRAAISWDERQNANLFFSRLPQYQNTAYEKLRQTLAGSGFEGQTHHQNDHHEWLFRQIDRRHDNPELIARLIWEQGVLPPEKVKSRLGDEVYARVLTHAGRYPMQSHYN
jgi:hypothetical protein